MDTNHIRPHRKRLLSIKETTKEFGGTVWFWRSQIWAGKIPVVQIGRKQWLDSDDLEKFIAENKRPLP